MNCEELKEEYNSTMADLNIKFDRNEIDETEYNTGYLAACSAFGITAATHWPCL